MDARASPGTGRKRKGGAGNRGRKKRKRLDAIRDRSPPAADSPEVRRSSRVRKAPVLLDSSPGPSGRKSAKRGGGIGVGRRNGKGTKRGGGKAGHSAKGGMRFVEDGSGEWGSRLRSRGGRRTDRTHAVSPDGKGFSLSKRDYVEPEEYSQQTEAAVDTPVDETDGSVTISPQFTKGKKRGRKPKKKKKKKKKKQKKGQLSEEEVETGNAPCSLNGEPDGDMGRNEIDELGGNEKEGEMGKPEKEQECHNASPKVSVVVPLEGKEVNITLVGKENDNDEEAFTNPCSLEGKEVDTTLVGKESDNDEEAFTNPCSLQANTQHEGNQDVFEELGDEDQDCEQNDVLENAEHNEQYQRAQMCIDGNADSPCCSSGEQDLQFSLKLNENCSQNDKNSSVYIPEGTFREKDVGLGGHNLNSATASDIHNPIKLEASERRRCGLCGRSDGNPPKRLVHDSAGSDNEAYNGSSSSDEPNYDALDGFGDDPEWLGRLLGPIRDHFGITRIWVHQHCAVWSPEVYFAGLGCLKNVRAALCRGRALKCCRCGRPGATIGCRVDRCPKTYHLPCARSSGCIFDHYKFLIACQDHRHHFQPQGYLYLHHIKRMKTKMLKLDMKKQSNEASRKDLEVEERWLENCGEDEEFLKRERRRLHRDVLRIAPVYIGGSSENKDLFQGWEAVAGLKDVIQCMKEVVILPLLYPEVFNSLGLTPRGILLHGCPGTGKTMVVRSLIGECSRGSKRIAYFARKGADCLGKYVGDAERQLRILFQAAERLQPSIVFFDEIDGLAPCRSRRQDQTHNSVVSTLLSLMDGLKSRGSVIVIGATNRPDSVDPALRRPGRFDREIHFPLPSFEDRSAILSLHTKNWPKPLSEPVLSWIAKETVGYAGADLHALCTQAAMIALKRNCPLQELLSSAEKGLRSGNRPSLPSFAVEEGDWLAALECSPPPCSRREAGMAANCVTLSPLQSHLLPCLLHPLSQLLISLYLNECVWLPPVLLRASKLIRNFIFSRMEQVNLPHASWMPCLPSLLHELEVAENIERILLHTGLLVGPSFSANMPNWITSYECSQSDSSRINTDSWPYSNVKQKAFGFRLLITGSQRSGQQHLAMSIIHGFMGDAEIQKINLATISQEGNGDIILGVTRILLKCLGLGRCILYLPRIDLWAANEVQTTESNEDSCTEALNSCKHVEFDSTKKSSMAWDSFTEQVDSASASSLIILATSEVQIHDLPIRVRQFFIGSQFKTKFSAFPQYTVPRFYVQLDGKFDSKLLINLYSAKLSQDLTKQFVLKIHQKCHCASVPGTDKSSDLSEEDCQGQSQDLKSTEATGAVHPERIVLNNAASIGGREIEFADCVMKQSATPGLRVNTEVYTQGHDHDSPTLHFPPNKVLKGNSMMAISSFGYQILRFPHFAELCWVTSKLKEGPSVDLTGSWNVWPFNSCIMRPTGSPSKICKDSKNLGVVRGLVAVGLQAYRSGYTCVKDVSFEVRKVLDLLVAEINAKILSGKDCYRFLRILSQVAYMDDLVRSWAYAFSSLQMESPALECDTTHVDEKQPTNGQVDKSKQPDNDDYSPNVEKNHGDQNLVSEKPCSPMLPSENGDSVSQSRSLVPEMDRSKMIVSSAPVSPSLNSNFSCKPTSPEKPIMMEVLGSSQIRSEAAEESNTLHMTKSCIDSGVPNEGGGSSDCHATNRAIVGSASCNITQPDKAHMTTDSTLENIISNTATSDTSSCLYECCSQCLHVVHVLTHKFLTDSCESNGCYSTVEDIHDALGSCSARLLAATSGCYSSQSYNKFEGEAHSEKPRRQADKCSCQNVEDVMHNKVGFGPHHSNDTMVTAEECRCHQKEAQQTNATGDICGLCQHPLRFFFKNSTLVPCDPSRDAEFHCNYSKLCLCPMLDGMLTCEQPPKLRW